MLKMTIIVNYLPYDKFLDRSKLKAFADDNFNQVKMMIYSLDREENIVGKEEKCWFPAFFFFSHDVFKSFPSKCREKTDS